LFSSADVDAGTRLLLKVLSAVLDEDAAAGRSPPRYVLDAGCGAGVIGICAAAAFLSMRRDAAELPLVRAQDRDELARLLTLYNAEKNGIPPAVLSAHTEPLLAGPPDLRWDLILTNIPAKAGAPVLEDFVRRSAALLNPGGRVSMVAVHTLADFFREQIRAAGAERAWEEKGAEHQVFVYRGTPAAASAAPVNAGPDFLARHPFYIRTSAACQIEDIPLRLETVYGASGFDAPGGAVLAAAKLARRLGAEKIAACSRNGPAALVHEPGQGFFSCWLLEFLRGGVSIPLILSGRNILALEAAQYNTEAIPGEHAAVTIIPAVDLRLGGQALPEAAARRQRGQQRYGFIAAFPELLPQSLLPKEADQLAILWEALPPLLAEGGVFIAAFGSTDAERFDRKKPAGFTRLGDIKRKGFRALGYANTPRPEAAR
jgi:hypothetical protein